MARIDIARGSSIARVAGPAQAQAVDASSGIAALGRNLTGIASELEKREKERRDLEYERIKTRVAIESGKVYQQYLQEAPEDGMGFQDAVMKRMKSIIDEQTAEFDEESDTALFKSLEGMRRDISLSAGSDEARMFGNEQIRDFETRVSEMAVLARAGTPGTEKYVELVDNEINALQVDEGRKADARIAARDTITSSYVRGLIDNYNVPQLQGLLEDLKDDQYADKLKPNTQEALIVETERALANRSRISNAAYKSGLRDYITALEENGATAEPKEFADEVMQQRLSDAEYQTLARDKIKAKVVGTFRSSARIMNDAQMDEYLRALRNRAQEEKDPTRRGLMLEAYEDAKVAGQEIANWRQRDPADYAMYASPEVSSLWNAYNTARDSGDAEAGKAAFAEYAAATAGLQTYYGGGGSVQILPKAEADAIRNTITDEQTPLDTRWSALHSLYNTAGSYGATVLRDVFRGRDELGLYMMSATLDMGEQSRQAFAAVAGYKDNKTMLGDVRLSELRQSAREVTAPLVNTYNDMTGKLPTHTNEFIAAVAANYVARGMTTDPSTAVQMAYDNTLGSNFYISGRLRVEATKASDPARIDRRREHVEALLPNVAASAFGETFPFQPGTTQAEKADVFNSATYYVKNSGDGNGVSLVMVSNGFEYVLPDKNGNKLVIPWDTYNKMDQERETRLGPVNIVDTGRSTLDMYKRLLSGDLSMPDDVIIRPELNQIFENALRSDLMRAAGYDVPDTAIRGQTGAEELGAFTRAKAGRTDDGVTKAAQPKYRGR